MRFRGAIIATAVFATPVLAMAQPLTGFYMGAGAGLHIPQGPDITPLTPGYGTGRVKLNEDYGFNSNLAVGYGIGNGFRFEIEGNFARSTDHKVSGIPFPTTSGGTTRTFGVMANALYDMDVGLPWMFPYVGAGAGYQWTKLNPLTTSEPGGPFSSSTSSQMGAFAWQAIVGASFPVPNVPGLSLTADYRFMDILGGAKYDGVVDNGGTLSSSRLKMHNQFDHDLVFGIRYAFNAPAPAAPPMAAPTAVPAPAPARSYLVFFDWDRSDLTERARSIVKEAADNSTRVQVTRIEVNGYTDTSGTPQYNQGLSIRRAQAVAGELVRDGVPKAAINIQGFGDTHLLVSTGPGVREPQNRRVEIIIR
jgi:outer membrane protein OmpA-like peptidoglycan-associated protein